MGWGQCLLLGRSLLLGLQDVPQQQAVPREVLVLKCSRSPIRFPEGLSQPLLFPQGQQGWHKRGSAGRGCLVPGTEDSRRAPGTHGWVRPWRAGRAPATLRA